MNKAQQSGVWNKAHFRNLLPNRFLPSSVGKALAWRSRDPGSIPTGGNFWWNFFALPSVKICQIIWQKHLLWKTQIKPLINIPFFKKSFSRNYSCWSTINKCWFHSKDLEVNWFNSRCLSLMIRKWFTWQNCWQKSFTQDRSLQQMCQSVAWWKLCYLVCSSISIWIYILIQFICIFERYGHPFKSILIH